MAWGFISKEDQVEGNERMKKLPGTSNGFSRSAQETSKAGIPADGRYAQVPFDKRLTFDKVTDVFHAGVAHDEDQPSHLHVLDTEICATRCAEEYANPCQRFCPASGYEMEFESATDRNGLKVNFSNC